MTVLLICFVVALVPVGIIWGWLRYFRNSVNPNTPVSLSFFGFALATISALLVTVTAAYAGVIGGFQWYDPRLIRIFRGAILLTGSSILVSVVGTVKNNPLRWFAPACSVGMGVVWFYLLLAE